MKNFLYKIIVKDHTFEILNSEPFTIANDIYSNKRFCLDQFEKWIKHIPKCFDLKDCTVKDEYYDKSNRSITWYRGNKKMYQLTLTLEKINRRMFY
jgi:hypothetical protein